MQTPQRIAPQMAVAPSECTTEPRRPMAPANRSTSRRSTPNSARSSAPKCCCAGLPGWRTASARRLRVGGRGKRADARDRRLGPAHRLSARRGVARRRHAGGDAFDQRVAAATAEDRMSASPQHRRVQRVACLRRRFVAASAVARRPGRQLAAWNLARCTSEHWRGIGRRGRFRRRGAGERARTASRGDHPRSGR